MTAGPEHPAQASREQKDVRAIRGEASGDRLPPLAIAFCAALLSFELYCFASTPFVSEDWTHLAAMRAIPSVLGALDPRIEPLRPLQHAFFWVLGHCGLDPAGPTLPLTAHAFGFLLHAASCALVFLLAREAGAGHGGPWLALVLFAAFPNVKSVAWSAAVGSPGRVLFELLALLSLVRHVREPSARRGAVGLGAFCLALGWHQSAMLLPALLAAWIFLLSGRSLREGIEIARRALRDPWLLAFFASGAAYVTYQFLRPVRYQHTKSLEALPANFVKAATALLPEELRVLIVDGFRAQGGPPYAVAGVLLALLGAAVCVLVIRSRSSRFVLLAIAIELGLPVISAGFVQRYAYFAAAIAAVGLALWVTQGGVARRAAALALIGFWAHDSIVDASDFRALGRRIPDWFENLRERRGQAGPDVSIAIVNPPDMVGAEEDIPLFNWGLDLALEAHHVEGPWLYWRTRGYRTSTFVELVDEGRLATARQSGSPLLYDWPDP